MGGAEEVKMRRLNPVVGIKRVWGGWNRGVMVGSKETENGICNSWTNEGRWETVMADADGLYSASREEMGATIPCSVAYEALVKGRPKTRASENESGVLVVLTWSNSSTAGRSRPLRTFDC